MLPLLLAIALLTLLYIALMALYAIGWKRQPAHIIPPGFVPQTRISVIIPARNERADIAACIAAILAQHYPPHLLEIILADDHSDDDTIAIAQQAGGDRITTISLKESAPLPGDPGAKKGALTAGIRAAGGALIVTTDADCTAPPQWLRTIAHCHETAGAVMIAGPVAFTNNGTLPATFQSLDFMSMQGITAAAHALSLGDMANGANLAFTREAFDAVGGYGDSSGLASGDDYLLLHKMRRVYPGGIHYLKSPDAIVRTAPQPTWAAFIQQRIRWASKSGKYGDRRLTALLLLVYLFNCSIIAAAIAGCWNPRWWLVSIGMIIAKWISETVFLLPVSRFYSKRHELLWLLPLQPLHIVYIALAGYLGMVGKYEWKGRELR